MMSIVGGIFRSSRAYRAVPRDELHGALRDSVRSFDETDFFGVLVPLRPEGKPAKAICHATARLFLDLEQPGLLPDRVLDGMGSRANQSLAKLVLDGILEVELDGEFVTGPAAFRSLLQGDDVVAPTGRIGVLSLEALVTAQHLPRDRQPAVARYLYRYNSVPVSPRWRRAVPTARDALDYLRTNLIASTPGTGDGTWSLANESDLGDHWMMWYRAAWVQQSGSARWPATCKLYVSPTCDATREALHLALPVLADSPALAFKIGHDLPGLLRPDKLVVYFAARADLMDVAPRLARVFGGLPAQGVPFSAALTDDGLLSWGADPPTGAQTFGWRGGESWRAWVTNRLAASLVAAPITDDAATAPWSYALACLELEGIDPVTFIPTDDLWAGATSMEGEQQ